MRVLLAVLLAGIVGCGSETEPPSPFSESEAKPPTAAVPPTPPESTQAKAENVVADTPQPKVDADPVTKPKPKSAPGSEPKADKPPAQVTVADAIAALKKLRATIKQKEQGEVVEVDFHFTDITDAGLVHLKGLSKLETLNLMSTEITDAGLVHLKGLSNLVGLNSSTVLDFIVPIAMISLGADFAIHAVHRYHQERRVALDARAGFRLGMGGVLAALVYDRIIIGKDSAGGDDAGGGEES